MGMLALTVDVGSIMFERRQLQNAADSTSMALAMNCAKDTTKCTPALNKPEMISLAGLNAADGLAQLAVRADAPDGMCGRNTGNLNMPLCASSATNAPIANLAECPPLPSSLASGQGLLTAYVETYSLTKSTATNNTILPSIFSRALTGAFTGKSHTACARAAYGPVAPTSDTVLALTMSECDWTSQTGYSGPGTATYPTGPSGAWPGYDLTTRPWPAFERAIYSKGNPTTCNTSSPGGTAPGGFAWLDTVSASSCLATVPVNGWVHGDTGNDGCSSPDLNNYRGTVIHVPVFDCMAASAITITATTNCNAGSGNNTYYHISGYAAFYLSGWWLTQSQKASIRPPGGYACANPDRCIFGWFLKDLVTQGDIAPPPPGGTPNYGLTVVKPAG